MPGASGLIKLAEKLTGVRALVAGDAILDHYVFGECKRICPEAPVPVFVPSHEEDRHGGMMNVKAQLDALGTPAWQWCSTRVSKKTRIMQGSHLLLRIDEDHRSMPGLEPYRVLNERLQRARAKNDLDVIVLSDYNKGWLTAEACQLLISTANELGIPSVVDPKGTSWTKYNHCTAICPNLAEYMAWDGKDFRCGVMVQKCGAEGLRLLKNSQGDALHFPARVQHVADVTGAGDTVVAIVAAVLGAKGSIEEACELANLAAGYIVGEVGTAVCPHETLVELIGEHHGGMQ